MRKLRKGFTLVELIIVIGIVGMLGVMGIVAGGEATNAANASKIIEDFRTLGAAMTMYYADNKVSIDKAGTVTAEQIKAGLAPYVKSKDMIATTAGVGRYNIIAGGTGTGSVGSEWWLQYKLPKAQTKLAQILANKALQEGLMAGTAANSGYFKADASKVDIYYQVK